MPRYVNCIKNGLGFFDLKCQNVRLFKERDDVNENVIVLSHLESINELTSKSLIMSNPPYIMQDPSIQSAAETYEVKIKELTAEVGKLKKLISDNNETKPVQDPSIQLPEKDAKVSQGRSYAPIDRIITVRWN